MKSNALQFEIFDPICMQLIIYEKIFERLVKKELDESTTGADASVEMPKLHNIKLLIAFLHMINNLILLHAKTQRVGNDRP